MEAKSDIRTPISLTVAARSVKCIGFLSFPYPTEQVADKYEEVFAIVAPVRIIPERDSSIVAKYACNLGSHCHNPACVYALPARQSRMG